MPGFWGGSARAHACTPKPRPFHGESWRTKIPYSICKLLYDRAMPINNVNYQSALQDFNEARLKASMQEALARLTGKSNELLSYEEVAQKLKLRARSDRGVHEIPVKAIVGSVGRYTDFTRTFLPRRA
jgi:hypothetical protein